MRKSVYTALAAGGVIALALTLSVSLFNETCEDATVKRGSDLMDLNNACDASVSHVEWIDWITGKSISYQFHYLDLLELLYSAKERSPSVGNSGR